MDIKKRVDKYAKIVCTYSNFIEVLFSVPNMNRCKMVLESERDKPTTIEEYMMEITCLAKSVLYTEGIRLLHKAHIPVPEKSSYLQIRFFDEEMDRITDKNLADMSFAEADYNVDDKNGLSYIIQSKIDIKNNISIRTNLIRYNMIDHITAALEPEEKKNMKIECYDAINDCWNIIMANKESHAKA